MTDDNTVEIKLIVVGDGGVGKTVILVMVDTDDPFDENFKIGVNKPKPEKEAPPLPRQTPRHRYPLPPTHQKRPMTKGFNKR